MTIVIHVSAWGPRFVQMMLPGLLSSIVAGEPAAVLETIDLEITTDDLTLREQPRFAGLRKFRSVTLFPIQLVSSQPHPTMARADRDFIARSAGKTMIFLPPDCVLASGTLSAALGHIAAGKKAVATAGIRCRAEYHPPPTLTPAALTAWGWARAHQFTLLQIWGAQPCWNHASCLWFPAPGGYVGRCYHLHPLVLVHDGRPIAFKSTIDDDLVAAIKPDEWHVVTDSAELALLEFSPVEKTLGAPLAQPLTAKHVAQFAARPTILPIHRHFFSHRIKFALRPGSFDAADQSLFPTPRA